MKEKELGLEPGILCHTQPADLCCDSNEGLKFHFWLLQQLEITDALLQPRIRGGAFWQKPGTGMERL